MAEFDFSSIKIEGNSHTDKNKSVNGNPNRTRSSTNDTKSIAKAANVKPIVKKDKLVKSKKSLWQRLIGTFIQEDIKDIKKYVIEEVIVPGIKGLVLDMISMALVHETFTSSRRSSSPLRTAYNSYYKSYNDYRQSSSNKNQDRRRDDGRYHDDNRERIDYRDIRLINRDDAEKIVDAMYEQLQEYHKVSIGDLYSLVEISPNPNDFNWGWTDERDIGIKKVSDGFLIDVADARYIE